MVKMHHSWLRQQAVHFTLEEDGTQISSIYSEF